MTRKAARPSPDGGRITSSVDARGAGLLVIEGNNSLNLLTGGLIAELVSAIRTLSRRRDIRVLVVTGAGERAFVGGASLHDMSKLTPPSARRFITNLHRACHGLRTFPVPVIGRVRGHCIGAGLELAVSCDLRAASEDARFAMPEVRVGIPSVIEAALLPQLVGWGRTRELLYTGNAIGAQKAFEWGLVDRLVPAARLDAEVESLVAPVLECGPNAIRLQKKLMYKWENLPVDRAVKAGIGAFAESFRVSEPKERMQAFLDRKKPE